MKDQLKWTICLQAALVSDYSLATHRQPGMLMQSHQIRVDNEPSPFLISIYDIIMPWNHQDYFILNSFPPEFHPDPTPELWDEFHQCITRRLKRDRWIIQGSLPCRGACLIDFGNLSDCKSFQSMPPFSSSAHDSPF